MFNGKMQNDLVPTDSTPFLGHTSNLKDPIMEVKQEEIDTFFGEDEKCSNDIFLFSNDIKQEIEIPKIDESEGIDVEEGSELSSLIMVTDTCAPINADNHCRAVHTLPTGFALMESRIKEGGCLGVFTNFFLPNGVGFGPCEGDITQEYSSRYCWRILRAGAVSHYLDSADGRRSNWMKFVKPSFVQSEQNLDIFQHKEQLYYKTTKDILANMELFLNGDSFLKYATVVMCRTFEVDKINKRVAQTLKLHVLGLKRRNKSMKKDISNRNSTSPGSEGPETTFEQPEKKDININVKRSRLAPIPVYVPENTTKNKITSLGSEGLETTFEQPENKDININAVKDMKYHNICTDAMSQNDPIDVTQIEKTIKHESFNGAITTFTDHSGCSKKKAFNCSVCEKTFTASDSLRRHLAIHTGDRRRKYSCKICGKLFTQRHSVIIHQRIHTGAKPYTCSTCGKSFRTSQHLVVHINMHTKEKLYPCTVCGKILHRSANLRSHMLLHEGEKPHKCDVCKREFTRFDHLKRHKETHLKLRSYKCELCGKRLARNSSLKQHMMIHANERPFECAICEKSFVQNNHLATHMKLHSGSRAAFTYECDECGKRFKLKQALRKHVKLHNE